MPTFPDLNFLTPGFNPNAGAEEERRLQRLMRISRMGNTSAPIQASARGQ